MQGSPPSPADQLASEYQLGMLRDTYFENKFTEQIMSLIGSLFVLAITGYILRQISPPLSWFSLVGLVIILVALYSVIKSGLTMISKYRQRGTACYIYEHGLIWLQYDGEALVNSDAVRWCDIAIVWHEVKEKYMQSGGNSYLTRLHFYRLQRKDGTLFGGEGYRLGPSKVILAVMQETMRVFWLETLGNYQRGVPVVFGPLTITQYGIQYEDRHLSWADVSIIDCSGSSEKLTINIRREQAKRNGWPIQIHIPFGEIPNAHVLRRLLIVAREQQGPPSFVLYGVFSKDIAKALSPVS